MAARSLRSCLLLVPQCAFALQQPAIMKADVLKVDLDLDDMPLPAPPTDFPKEVDATVQHMKRFVDAAPKDAASLLLMGDSTIRTMNNMMLWIGEATSLHVKNDRPSDGGLPYPVTTKGSILVEPGHEWHDERYSQHPAVLRAMAASKEIRDLGCTWGGSIETVLLGAPMDSLIVHYWNFLPEYSRHGCWQKCMADAVAKLQPRAMMWNIGMHMMNEQFDVPTCQKRSSHRSSNCGDYENLVTLGMRDLSAVVPTLIWKTTNSICDKKLKETHNPDDMDKWLDPAQRPSMEEQCHRACPFFESEESCYDWLSVQATTERMHKLSTKVVEQYQTKHSTFAKVSILDAYEVTKTCCEHGCPDTPDGMHYINGTDASLMQTLAQMIADDETERKKSN